jgi:prevent-host-death family protein
MRRLERQPSNEASGRTGGGGDLIDRARLAGEPTIITHNGKPDAVVVSADWYQEAAARLARATDGPGRDQAVQ